MQADQKRTAADRQAQLRQYGKDEYSPWAVAERSRGILDCRIESPDLRGNRKVEKRKICENRNENAAEQPLQPRHQTNPGIAVNEGGNGERRNRKPRPETCA